MDNGPNFKLCVGLRTGVMFVGATLQGVTTHTNNDAAG